MQPPRLPIHAQEEDIVAAVKKHAVVVVIAETGSGKTTQIAQMLHRAGLTNDGMIGVTQPRRVAAVSVARRVAQEMGVELGREVGYAVRFEDRSAGAATRIKYLTDGTLLREVLEDAQLLRYSVLVLDEAHERSLNTDIMFGVLKALTRKREPPLRLVVTSATLQGDKFSRYFSGCPVLDVPGRCFDVQLVHAAEEVPGGGYVQAAVDTALDIHCAQPPGDILVFLTGQAEIDKAARLLSEGVADLQRGEAGPLLVLPLYAALPPEMQVRIFQPPPNGVRRCIVATNIAETSVTVPGVVYVVDPGRVKQKEYNPVTGMDSLDVVPISKVQATQRAGRAGRTQPGMCFRLYTRRFFEREMPDVTVPEIQRMTMVGAVLYLKSLALGVDVLRFDWLDPPTREQLEDALRQLYVLDAIDLDGAITPLGRCMATLPLDPSLCRALLAAQQLGCLQDMLTVAAMLSIEMLFVGNRGPQQLISDSDRAAGGQATALSKAPHINEQGKQLLQQLMREGLGDHVFYLRLYRAWELSNCSLDFCRSIGVDGRGMRFARDVRRQIARIIEDRQLQHSGDAIEDRRGIKRTQQQREQEHAGEGTATLRKALLIGFANRLAYRLPLANGYKPLGGRCASLAHVHPLAAALVSDDDGLLPKWLVYHELVATGSVFLSKVCAIEPACAQAILTKVQQPVDVQRLSGGAFSADVVATTQATKGAQQKGSVLAPVPPAAKRTTDDAALAARQRYLARKVSKTTSAKKG